MKKLFKIIMLFFITLVIFISFSIASASNTYYVSKNGSDSNLGTEENSWLTIQHAADIMTSGDTVVVLAGNYSSERIITKDSGTSGNYILFKASGVVITKGFNIKHDYIVVDGFTITGTANADSNGVGIASGCDYVTVKNCTIHDTDATSFFSNGIYLFYIAPLPTHCTLDNNKIYDVYNCGITIHGSYHTVSNNEIYNLKNNGGDSDGIRFFGDHHTLSGNYIHDIMPTSGDPHVDAFQTFDNGFDASNIIIENNRVENIQDDFCMISAVTRSNSHDITIRNNWIRIAGDGGLFGAFIQNIDNLYVYNNTWVDSGTTHSIRIYGDDMSGVVVKNNIYYGGSHYLSETARTGSDVSNNLVYPQNTNGDFADGDGINGSDPRFVDYNNQNYYPQPDSPCIDAAATIDSFSDDRNGITRPKGSAWDIGAYEYITNAKPSARTLELTGQ